MKPTLDVHTPTLRINDGRGLPVRHVAYLRKAAGATAQALATRHIHDSLGRLIEQWDPRLHAAAPKPNISSVYRLSGAALRVDSVDAGQRLNLAGIAHQELQRWDARGTHWQTDHDNQLRIVAVHQRPEGQAPSLVERLTYADASADPMHNRRGQVIHRLDLSGELSLNSFSLHGLRREETRTFADGPACTSRWQYSATARVLTQIDAAGHRQISRFDVAGQLKGVRLQLKNADTPQDIVSTLRYNAAGQIETKVSANHVLSTWTYDPANGRLDSHTSGVPGQDLCQNLSYGYDPVGNVLRIDDRTLTPVFFANQRVDGRRTFIYDSLYRLLSASGFEGEIPHLHPGLPELSKPEDPGARFNYTQHFDYDLGGNLTRLRHVRDGHCHTRCLRIHPHSNRGLPWKEGDPDPVFDEAFDAHGNLKALNTHQPLHWNTQDQLAGITLVSRETGLDDEETYAYSQGTRVYKHQVTQAKTVSHTRDVRYLPGLEIRTLDDREELHVITLPGSVRCLHWVKGQPDGIDNNQLRYSLDDHLGSSSLELGQNGELISHEIYYPFGGTAWWSARSVVEANYRTVRYSGKEMDASGLYYYGLRYYAPWLQRWVSADPGGDVDGLNLYVMVGNNPLLYVDRTGGQKEKTAIHDYSSFISTLAADAEQTLEQVDNIINKTNIGKELLKNTLGEGLISVAGFFGGFYASELLGALLQNAGVNMDPFIVGFIGGNTGGELAGRSVAQIIAPLKLVRPLVPLTSSMTIKKIDRKAGLDVRGDSMNWVERGSFFLINNVVGTVVAAVGAFLGLGSRVQEAEDIKNGLDPVKIGKIENMLIDWKTTVKQRWATAEAAYDTLRTDAINPPGAFNSMTPQSMQSPIRRATLQQQTRTVLDFIDRAEKGMSHYKEMRTTDNQFLQKQARANKRR